MASASSVPTSTKETTNYARLCRVLVDLGTCALRDCFDAIFTPPTLHKVLAASQPTLQSLRSRRIINVTQWGNLFPSTPASVSSTDFDITLLVILFRNICGMAPPLTGWDALPAATDVSREADIAQSNTSEIAFMLMPITLLSMMQLSTNTGRKFEKL